MTRPRWKRLALGPFGAAVLLAAHFALCVLSSRHDSITFDEPVYLSAGTTGCLTHDYRIGPDAGVVAPRWAAIPLLVTGTHFPDLNQPAWWVSDGWVLSHEILYELGNDSDRVLLLARSQIALLSVALGILVWLWSRHLFGPAGGAISLAVYAFSPAFLAHGHILSADVPAALLLPTATWACWRTMGRVSPGTLAMSSLATGLLFLAKMSAVLVLPTALVLLVVRLVSSRPLVVAVGRERLVNGWGRKLLALLPVLLLHVAVTVFLIWAAFSFRYSAFAEAVPGRDIMRGGGWPSIAGAGACEPFISFAREHHLLPEAWLFAFQYVLKYAQVRRGFALGHYSMTGWWWYFPLTFSIKTPLAAIGLGGVALATLAATLARWRRRATDAWLAGLPGVAAAAPLELVPLLALLLVYGVASLTSPLNLGIRHLLPALVPLFVLCGAAAWVMPLHRRAGLALGVLLVLGACDTLLAFPHYLAYFNAFGGAPARRWHVLVDSSLDWGQGLKELRETLEAPGGRLAGETVYVGYFGVADPGPEGLAAIELPAQAGPVVPTPVALLEPGLYAISATTLVQLYSSFPGRWATPYEELWTATAPAAEKWLATHEPSLPASGDAQALDVERHLRGYEQLRMARLCAFLRQRTPDDVVDAGSILVWRLSAADLDTALHGPPPESGPIPAGFPWAGQR